MSSPYVCVSAASFLLSIAFSACLLAFLGRVFVLVRSFARSCSFALCVVTGAGKTNTKFQSLLRGTSDFAWIIIAHACVFSRVA